MKNKLNEEQQKRFNEKFRTGAENNLEMYDDSLGANCFSNAGIAPLARYLADEIASAMEEDRNSFIGFVFRCTQPDKGDLFDVIDDLMSEYTSSKEKND